MSELIKMFMDDDGNEVPEEKATRLNIVTSNAFVRMKALLYRSNALVRAALKPGGKEGSI